MICVLGSLWYLSIVARDARSDVAANRPWVKDALFAAAFTPLWPLAAVGVAAAVAYKHTR